MSFITLVSGQIIFGTPVFAVTNPTLTINLGSLSSLDLMPGNFGSVSQSVGITTNNYTGYTVNLTNPTNSTDLINTHDNTLTIPTITLPNGVTSITENDFDSGYGISIDGTNYLPAPTSNSDGILIGSSNIAGTNSYTLTFGAKPASDTKAGIYSKTFVITAIVNHPQYSITYNANAGTDTVTDMPTNQSTITSTTGTVTLPSDVPIRSGYTFLGWDTNSTATTPTYPTGTTNTITLEPTQANAIILYAVWGQSGGGGTWDNPIEDNTTTTYDPNNIPANSTIIYEAISGQPQVTTDASGNITRFEYMDTSASNPLALNSGFDTGVLVFNNTGFTISLTGSFPWTTNGISPLVSLSGLINDSASGLNVNISYNRQNYTNLNGQIQSSSTYVDRIRCFQYSSGNLSNTKNLMYSSNPTANVTESNNNTLGWAQSQAPLVGTIVITGTPNGNAMEIDVKTYQYNAQNDTDTIKGILPARYTYSITGLQSSGITIELGYYQRNINTSYSYAFTIYKFSVIKN